MTETYSPGLEGVVAGETSISTVETGLTYRGYTIEDLGAHATYEEVAYLILYGELPTATQAAAFRERLGAAAGSRRQGQSRDQQDTQEASARSGSGHPRGRRRTKGSILVLPAGCPHFKARVPDRNPPRGLSRARAPAASRPETAVSRRPASRGDGSRRAASPRPRA